MRYYSIMRLILPGGFPKKAAVEEIHNFDSRTYCEAIGREAWGYVDYREPLTEREAGDYELIPEGIEWYPVVVASKKHGGGLVAMVEEKPVRATERPQDRRWEYDAREYKRRYFKGRNEAERVADILDGLEITIERQRMSVTQGECRVFVNGTYILNFGDEIVLLPKGADKSNYYGEQIGDYMSSKPDSTFVLGLIWHPYDDVYHYSEMVCKKLGIEPGEWI